MHNPALLSRRAILLAGCAVPVLAEFAQKPPLTVGILIDTNAGQKQQFGPEREALNSFLDSTLSSGDKAFILHFDTDPELLQDLTSSREKLDKALGALQSPDERSDGGQGARGGVLHDALYLAASEILAKRPGRKVIILITDGNDHGSKTSLDEALTALQRADVKVYTILSVDERPKRHFGNGGQGGGRRGGSWPGQGTGWPGGDAPSRRPGGEPGSGRGENTKENVEADRKVLQQIASQSGGDFYEVSKKNSFPKILKQIKLS